MNSVRTIMNLLLGVTMITILAACGGSVSDNGGNGEPGEPEPLAIAISADRDTVAPGETVTLTATITGDEAGASNVTWAATYGSFSAMTGTTVTWTAPATVQTVTIGAELTAGSDSVTDSLEIDVTENPDDPGDGDVLAITISADRDTVAQGESVTLNASISGDEAEAGNVAWTATAGAFSVTGGENTIWTAPGADGTFTVTAELSAGTDTVTDSVSIEVTSAPAAPLAISVSSPTDSAVYGQVISLEAVVTGDGADGASVTWTAESDHGEFSATAGRATAWTAPISTGLVTITASIAGEDIDDAVIIDVQLCSSGTVENDAAPCGITNIHQLQGINQHPTGNFRLSGDIDAAETEHWNDGAGFLPIVTFAGSLNGDGHGIRNLHINRPDSDDVGLFGQLGDDAAITNLNLENADILGRNRVGSLVGTSEGKIVGVSSSGTVMGRNDIGGLIGYNTDEVNESSSTATVSGQRGVGGLAGGNTGTILASYTTNGTRDEPGVISSGDSAGGLVGANWGAIADSYSGSHIDSSGSNTGGLVGNNLSNDGQGYIDRSYSSAAAVVKGTWNVGGLTGNNFGDINQSYSLAASAEGTNRVGGLVGYHRTLGGASTRDGTIKESYSTSLVQGNSDVGGLVGESEPDPDVTVSDSFWDMQRSNQTVSAGGIGAATVQMVHEAIFSNWDFDDVWFIDEGRGTPDLISNPRQ